MKLHGKLDLLCVASVQARRTKKDHTSHPFPRTHWSDAILQHPAVIGLVVTIFYRLYSRHHVVNSGEHSECKTILGKTSGFKHLKYMRLFHRSMRTYCCHRSWLSDYPRRLHSTAAARHHVTHHHVDEDQDKRDDVENGENFGQGQTVGCVWERERERECERERKGREKSEREREEKRVRENRKGEGERGGSRLEVERLRHELETCVHTDWLVQCKPLVFVFLF